MATDHSFEWTAPYGRDMLLLCAVTGFSLVTPDKGKG